MQAQANMGCIAGVLGLLLFIPCFSLGSGLYGDYPPMHDAGLKMLHDMYLDSRNTTGFWEALQVYRDSSAYRLVHPHTSSACLDRCSCEHPQLTSLTRCEHGGLLPACLKQKSSAVNTSGFWEALQALGVSSTYHLACILIQTQPDKVTTHMQPYGQQRKPTET